MPRIALVAALAGAAVSATACHPHRATVAPAPAQGSAQESARAAATTTVVVNAARYPWTPADVHFMSAMIGHHAQAITMSRMAPTHGASASVLRLADRIINAQQDEIASMQQWLRDRGQPVPDAVAGPMKMNMGGMVHEMLMPGMLTEAQMQQLDAARGAAFDKLFLQFMIQHHRGATSMVQELFNTYGAAQDETVFKFANDVNVDQTTEIARMQKMLDAIAFDWTAP